MKVNQVVQEENELETEMQKDEVRQANKKPHGIPSNELSTLIDKAELARPQRGEVEARSPLWVRLIW
jgi:hypothetical protein